MALDPRKCYSMEKLGCYIGDCFELRRSGMNTDTKSSKQFENKYIYNVILLFFYSQYICGFWLDSDQCLYIQNIYVYASIIVVVTNYVNQLYLILCPLWAL